MTHEDTLHAIQHLLHDEPHTRALIAHWALTGDLPYYTVSRILSDYDGLAEEAVPYIVSKLREELGT